MYLHATHNIYLCLCNLSALVLKAMNFERLPIGFQAGGANWR